METSARRFKLSDGSRTFFVKLQPAARIALFETEAAGLAQLQAAQALRVPQALCHGVAAGQAYLVLEYLPLVSQGDAALLGRQLAQQHRVTAPQFGWTRDNWIGATPQPNGWRDDWIDFWREQRLGFQLRLAAENGYGGALQRDGEILMSHSSPPCSAAHAAASLVAAWRFVGRQSWVSGGWRRR